MSQHHLKVYNDDTPEVVRPEIEGVGSLPALLESFRRATGRSLRYRTGPQPNKPADLTWSAPANPGTGISPGHLRLEPAAKQSGKASAGDPRAAKDLAAAVAGVVNELLDTRHALWQREAELAAGVPVVPHRREEQHLAARLQLVLKAAVEAVGADAAGLYLIDEATTVLKLRASWGLPPERLTDPPRAMKGALADLEALLGHAVVLEDTALMEHWKVPEGDFGAAVCVPVSTSTTILGTLWIYSTAKRDFNSRETNVVEVVAGRVAADLEREMLLREGIGGAQLKRRLDGARRWQRSHLPSVAPLADGWDMAGWTDQAESIGGDFFDWFCLDDGRLAVCVGDALEEGLEAALSAAALRTALRCHARYRPDGHRLLDQTNLTIWTGSAGDQFASAFFALVDPNQQRVCYSTAGDLSVVRLRPGGWESLSTATPPLGAAPDSSYREQECQLGPGEVLVVFTDGVRDAVDAEGRPLGEAGLAKALGAKLDLSATDLVALARDRLEAHTLDPERLDRTVLVIKPTTP